MPHLRHLERHRQRTERHGRRKRPCVPTRQHPPAVEIKPRGRIDRHKPRREERSVPAAPAQIPQHLQKITLRRTLQPGPEDRVDVKVRRLPPSWNAQYDSASTAPIVSHRSRIARASGGILAVSPIPARAPPNRGSATAAPRHTRRRHCSPARTAPSPNAGLPRTRAASAGSRPPRRAPRSPSGHPSPHPRRSRRVRWPASRRLSQVRSRLGPPDSYARFFVRTAYFLIAPFGFLKHTGFLSG
jgi:hypothetical protein